MKNGEFGLRFASIVVVWTLAPAAAMAYIDPGSGAYMVQAIFAVVGAALFYLRNPVRSAKALWHWAFSSRKRADESAVDSSHHDEVISTGETASQGVAERV